MATRHRYREKSEGQACCARIHMKELANRLKYSRRLRRRRLETITGTSFARCAPFTVPRRKKGERGHEEERGYGGRIAYADAYDRLGFSRQGYRVAKTAGSATRRGRFRFIPQLATSVKLDAPWPTFARSQRRARERVADGCEHGSEIEKKEEVVKERGRSEVGQKYSTVEKREQRGKAEATLRRGALLRRRGRASRKKMLLKCVWSCQGGKTL